MRTYNTGNKPQGLSNHRPTVRPHSGRWFFLCNRKDTMAEQPANPEVYRRRCARCRHTERLHLWSKSDNPKSKKWTLGPCWL